MAIGCVPIHMEKMNRKLEDLNKICSFLYTYIMYTVYLLIFIFKMFLLQQNLASSNIFWADQEIFKVLL